MEPVLTHRAKIVVDAARLHRVRHRRESGLCLVEGPDLVADVIASGSRVLQVFGLADTSWSTRRDVPELTPVDERALARLAGTKTPRGPVAVVEIPDSQLNPARNLVVGVGLSDPGNVGTIIRTAAAFGWGYGYTTGSADPWGLKTIRAGAGGQFQTAVSHVELDDILERWVSVALIVREGETLESISERPIAVMVGEESRGLPEVEVRRATHRVTIPMAGPTESLNASISAAIAMHELSKPSGVANPSV